MARHYLPGVKLLPDNHQRDIKDQYILIAKCRREVGGIPGILAEALKAKGWKLKGAVHGGWSWVYGIPPADFTTYPNEKE